MPEEIIHVMQSTSVVARKASLIDVILFCNEQVSAKNSKNMQIQLKTNKESNFPILNFTKAFCKETTENQWASNDFNLRNYVRM